MRAGKLDRELIILRKSEDSVDAFNEPVEVWAPLSTVWGQQRPNRGSERFQAQQLTATTVITFHIRYFPGLKVTDRIEYEGRQWDILDIREIGRRVVHELDCKARADAIAEEEE